MTVRMTLMPDDGDPREFLVNLGIVLEPEREQRSRRYVIKSGRACPDCKANSDPDRVPVHPGCQCSLGGDTTWDTMRSRLDGGRLIRGLDDLLLRELHREGLEQVEWLSTLDDDAANAVRAWFAGNRDDILDGWTEGGPMTERALAFRRGVEGQPSAGTVVYHGTADDIATWTARQGQVIHVTDKPLAVHLDPGAVAQHDVVFEIAGRAHTLDTMEAVVLPGHEYLVESVTGAPVPVGPAGALRHVVRLVQTTQ